MVSAPTDGGRQHEAEVIVQGLLERLDQPLNWSAAPLGEWVFNHPPILLQLLDS